MTDLEMTPAGAQIAKEALEARINVWMKIIIEDEGFMEWKRAQVAAQIETTVDPLAEPIQLPQFSFPPEIEKQHEMVVRYYAVAASFYEFAEVEQYFLLYPFTQGEVSREAHLRTCVELMFSRIYNFKTRVLKLLKHIDRKTQPRNSLRHDELKRQFEKQFETMLGERNSVTHEARYTDYQLDALGVGDMLANANDEFSFMRMSPVIYLTIANVWIERLHEAREGLNLWLGLVSWFMLSRCTFLSEPSQAD